jgi:hypothetical protein
MESQGAEIRDYRPSDLEQVKAIHETSGLDYRLPNFENSLFVVRKVVEFDGRIIAAGFLRVEAEAYLFLAKDDWGDPLQKLAAINAVQTAALHEAWTKGLDNCVCWVPKEVNSHFAKRLLQLGWIQDREGWISWSRSTK